MNSITQNYTNYYIEAFDFGTNLKCSIKEQISNSLFFKVKGNYYTYLQGTNIFAITMDLDFGF
jgi:hypothetical protein